MFRFVKRLFARRGPTISNNNASLGDDIDYDMRGPTIDRSNEQDPIRRYILNPTGDPPRDRGRAVRPSAICIKGESDELL